MFFDNYKQLAFQLLAAAATFYSLSLKSTKWLSSIKSIGVHKRRVLAPC